MDKDYRILVADDEKNMRDVVRQIIQYAGYDCAAVASGDDVLAYMRSHYVDVLITDIVMPGMDGMELTGRVKRNFDADVLVMTGYAKNYSFEEIIEKGANDFIEKPIRSNELIVRLKRILKERAVLKERNRVQAELVESEGRLRELAKRLKETEEKLRKDLARELHDRVGQNLTALAINLDFIRDGLPTDVPEKAGRRLEDARRLVVETTDHIRDVMARLRPVGLDEYGLVAALHWYGNRFASRTGISVNVNGNGDSERLTPECETELFRIAQEALTNVAKHARAKHVDISLLFHEDSVRLAIADNGGGFDLNAAVSGSTDSGWGMLSMKERAHALNGVLHIRSTPGIGTVVEIKTER